MKKLSKIRLHNAIVMNDCEMKSVTGGFVTGGEDSGSGLTGTCGVNIFCGSARAVTIRGISKSEAQSEASAFMQNPDAIAYTCRDYSGAARAYWCCDSCD